MRQQSRVANVEDVLQAEFQVEAHRHRSSRLVTDLATQLQTRIKSGDNFAAAWNALLPEVAGLCASVNAQVADCRTAAVSAAHCMYTVVQANADGVAEVRLSIAQRHSAHSRCRRRNRTRS